jgi:hypothetical protein
MPVVLVTEAFCLVTNTMNLYTKKDVMKILKIQETEAPNIVLYSSSPFQVRLTDCPNRSTLLNFSLHCLLQACLSLNLSCVIIESFLDLAGYLRTDGLFNGCRSVPGGAMPWIYIIISIEFN